MAHNEDTPTASAPATGSGDPDSARPIHSRWRERATTAAEQRRADNEWLDHLWRAWVRYRDRRVDHLSLVVVYRGLFLAVSVLLIFLYVLGRVTSVTPDGNEIWVPTIDLSPNIDLGAIVRRTYAESSGTLLDIAGGLTLVLSATATAHALSAGSADVFCSDARAVGTRPPRRAWQHYLRDFILGLGIALVVLVSWLLALATLIRTSSVSDLIGVELPPAEIPLARTATVLVGVIVVAVPTGVVLRRSWARGRPSDAPGRGVHHLALATAIFAAFVVAANYGLLYANIAALVDPHTSSGIVLVLTMLVWVTAVVRGLFYLECWLAETGPARDGAGTTAAADSPPRR